MIITYFRSSSFNRWEFCPQLWFIEYVLGWQGKDTRATVKGTVVHKVLELLGRQKLAKQNDTVYVDDDIIGKIPLNKIDDVDYLLEKVFDCYTQNASHIIFTQKDYKEMRVLTYRAIEFNDGMFDPRNKNIIAVEKRFDFEIYEPWAMYDYDLNGKKVEGFLAVKGTIDQISSPAPDTIEITDWKTGKLWNWDKDEPKDHKSFRDDPQLRLYHYAATKLYPEISNFMCTIFYIKKGGPFTICFDAIDLKRTKEIIKQRFEEIKETQIPRLKRGYKCTKFCDAGLTTFKGTHINPLIQNEERTAGSKNISPIGETMCKCDQIKYTLKHRDMDTVLEHLANPEHNINKYSPPGKI